MPGLRRGKQEFTRWQLQCLWLTKQHQAEKASQAGQSLAKSSPQGGIVIDYRLFNEYDDCMVYSAGASAIEKSPGVVHTNIKSFSLRSASVFLLAALSLLLAPSFVFSVSPALPRTQTIIYPGMMPGEIPAFADFDGDQKQDIAVARLSDDRYQILVTLSTGAGAIILTPSVQIAGFTVHACDINGDRFSDVVVTSSVALHPLAVWLGNGKGKFKIVDPKLFEHDCGFTESSGYQSRDLPLTCDFLSESPHPVFEKTTPAFGDPLLERHGFLSFIAIYCASHNLCFYITPRSPPINIPL